MPAARQAATPTFAGITLSNPDKVYYPDIGVTKLDVARYYQTVAPFMLPYVVRRPISLVRCPEGIDKEHFFQRHAMKGMSKAIKEVPIPGGESKKKYLYIDDEAGLFGLVQIGVLEIHDWGVSLPKVSEPDHIVFDLDPDEDLDFSILKAAAVEVRDFLAELRLQDLPQGDRRQGTARGRAAHAEARLGRGEGLRQGSRRRAGRRRGPTATRRTWRRRSAPGKIFVDYLRNQRGGTAICNYSTRARPRRDGRLSACAGTSSKGLKSAAPLHREDAAGAAQDR